jgi:hypothetical protein
MALERVKDVSDGEVTAFLPGGYLKINIHGA